MFGTKVSNYGPTVKNLRKVKCRLHFSVLFIIIFFAMPPQKAKFEESFFIWQFRLKTLRISQNTGRYLKYPMMVW
jgi:hypothetical protein